MEANFRKRKLLKWNHIAGYLGYKFSGNPLLGLVISALGPSALNVIKNGISNNGLLGGQLDLDTDKGQDYWNNLNNYIAGERAWNSAEAQKNRDFQERMANTSVQRSVADIQAAGLNPWLAVQGSSALSGGSYSGAQAETSGASSAAVSMMNANMNNQVKLISGIISALTSVTNSAIRVVGSVAGHAAK